MTRKFELKTIQVGAIKSLIEALKEMLTETTLEISPKGIKITATDPSCVIMVHLFLEAENFESYHCDETMVVGINIINLFKITRTIANNDTLTFYIDYGKEQFFGISLENNECNYITDHKLNTIDIDEDQISAPDHNFGMMITIPSQQFQKVCRDAYVFSNIIEIKSMDSQLIFSCKGDIASFDKTFAETEEIEFEACEDLDNKTILQGYFLLKHLVLFSKCANLCQKIKLYLANEKPLVIEFSVGNLGSLKLALAPQINEASEEY